ncbi:protein eva-1 homolog C [Trichomycterus rosablanca]|uniref:protein eva-1 homolog C n=1 Tax=Trichomycterus rosablanca TaxID=2290929 RepID=UPI002F3588BE
MPPLCNCSWSWCFLFFLLALNFNHASFAPDFSDFLYTVLKNHTGHACEGETLTIKCPSKTTVAVLSTFYGRRIPSQHLCPTADANVTEESTDCTSNIAIQKVVSECQDQRVCHIHVASPMFGQDPCPETSKYLIVSYKCRPALHHLKTVCENERLRLACKNDTVLAIYSATFGHLGHDSHQCPQGNVKPDMECLSPTALRRVSRKCHGRTNCSLLADVQNFGDPCFPGTSKHLRVSFMCVPRYLLEDVGRGRGADPFRISDYTHGGWYTGPGVYRPQNIFTNSLEIFSLIQGLPETVALYFVSGICAGLVFLLCIFGVKSTLVKDVKDLVSELEDEIKAARRSRRGMIEDFYDDNSSLDSSFQRLTRSYRAADMLSPGMVMTVVVDEKKEGDRDKAEVPNGDILQHCNSSPYAIHKPTLLSG